MEQKLTDAKGLPGRPWYRHFVYAPGVLTGYGVKTLPGVREAIDGDRWDEAAAYIPITAAVLARYCDALDEARGLLGAGHQADARRVRAPLMRQEAAIRPGA